LEAQLVQRKNINVEEWDQLVSDSPQGNLFLKSWYIDALLTDWQAIMVHDGCELQGVMPLSISRKYFLKYALQPMLTRYWGVSLKNKQFGSSYDLYSWQKKVVEAIAGAIPSGLFSFLYYFHPAFNYPLPFHWKGCRLESRYTYRIPLHRPMEALEKDAAKAVRKKSARALSEYKIETSDDFEAHLKLIGLNGHSDLILPETYFPAFRRIYQCCIERQRCFILSASDENGELMASALFLHDERNVYFFSGIIDPKYRQTAVMPAIVMKAIEITHQSHENFDFMGSMVESIESFFRSFGAVPQPYLTVSKQKFAILR
jgi:hypothetical protein